MQWREHYQIRGNVNAGMLEIIASLTEQDILMTLSTFITKLLILSSFEMAMSL